MSYNCKNLIKKLLEPNKKKRIKASDALRHPFFTEFFNPSQAMTSNKDLNILKRLINYQMPVSKFHEAMYAFICNNFLSIDEEKSLRSVFRYIDKEGKNSFRKNDLNTCLKEINVHLSSEGLDTIFTMVDANKNNKIEYQEFLRSSCNRKSLLTKENLKNTFMALSGGAKEFINAENIKNFIFHDADIQDDILNEYLEQFGMKKDQKINFEQFCNILINNKKLNEIEEVKEEDNFSDKNNKILNFQDDDDNESSELNSENEKNNENAKKE